MPEFTHDGRGQHSGERRRQADDDVPDRGALHLVDFAACALRLLQDAPRVREQPLAGLRRHRAATVAQEQVLAQFDLEAPDLPADRRLRDAQAAVRPG